MYTGVRDGLTSSRTTTTTKLLPSVAYIAPLRRTQATIITPLHLANLGNTSMRTMYSPLFQTAGFQLAVVVLFATAPFIIATTPSSQPGIQRRDNGLPTGWLEIGCYSTSSDRPTLTATGYSDTTDMTVDNCIAFCNARDKTLAGVENGIECHCGKVMTIGAANDSASNCLTPCSGNHDQFCGGKNSDTDFMNIYSNGDPLQPFPTIAQNPQNWFLAGCFLDSDDARTLSTPSWILLDNVNSADNCVNACIYSGFSIAGVEFADECWCDNSIKQGRKPVDPAFCPLACPGNSDQICGGAHTMVIYSEKLIDFGPA